MKNKIYIMNIKQKEKIISEFESYKLCKNTECDENYYKKYADYDEHYFENYDQDYFKNYGKIKETIYLQK